MLSIMVRLKGDLSIVCPQNNMPPHCSPWQYVINSYPQLDSRIAQWLEHLNQDRKTGVSGLRQIGSIR